MVQLSCGLAHALALTCEGALYSFGARSAASGGALGREVGQTTVTPPPAKSVDRLDLALARTPSRVGGLLAGRRVLQVS